MGRLDKGTNSTVYESGSLVYDNKIKHCTVPMVLVGVLGVLKFRLRW